MAQKTNASIVWKKVNPEDTDPYIKTVRESILYYDEHYHAINLKDLKKKTLESFKEGHLYEIKDAVEDTPLISFILTREKEKIFISFGIKSHNLLAGSPFKIPVITHFKYLKEQYKRDWCILKDWQTSDTLFEWFSSERTLWATNEVELKNVSKVVSKIKQDLDCLFPYIFYIYKDILNAEVNKA